MIIIDFIKKNVPGILVCAVIGAAAYFTGLKFPVIGGPVSAILFGMIFARLMKNKSAVQNGIKFTSKKILQYAVILLGFGMNISAILARGIQSLPVIIATITTSLVTAFIFSKILHITGKISTLIGVGSSICGGSAIAAAAPVIDADDEEIAQSISVIFLFNICAAVIFPPLGASLGMTNEGFALFAGTAINDTSSVTAAATAWDGLHGSNILPDAAIVKLTRTLAIIPITLVLAVVRMRKEESSGKTGFNFTKIFPWFVLWFILASIITTVFNLGSGTVAPLKWLSKFFIIMAMAAIGLNTDIVKLIKKGGKPILLGFLCWICIIGASLFVQHIMHIW
ncbi:MAG: YeiH family protein [Treponema sp.]|nr:YeiH family protein [Treponema sp.]